MRILTCLLASVWLCTTPGRAQQFFPFPERLKGVDSVEVLVVLDDVVMGAGVSEDRLRTRLELELRRTPGIHVVSDGPPSTAIVIFDAQAYKRSRRDSYVYVAQLWLFDLAYQVRKLWTFPSDVTDVTERLTVSVSELFSEAEFVQVWIVLEFGMVGGRNFEQRLLDTLSRQLERFLKDHLKANPRKGDS